MEKIEKNEKKEDTDERPAEITMSYYALIYLMLFTVVLTVTTLAVSLFLTLKIAEWWR